MRQLQTNKRPRSSGSKSGYSGNSRRSSMQGSRNFESNGPDVKIKGTPQQIIEKYESLSRDALSAGDRVMAESYSQHAEHYFRVMSGNLSGDQNQTDNEEQSERSGKNQNWDRKQKLRSVRVVENDDQPRVSDQAFSMIEQDDGRASRHNEKEQAKVATNGASPDGEQARERGNNQGRSVLRRRSPYSGSGDLRRRGATIAPQFGLKEKGGDNNLRNQMPSFLTRGSNGPAAEGEAGTTSHDIPNFDKPGAVKSSGTSKSGHDASDQKPTARRRRNKIDEVVGD